VVDEIICLHCGIIVTYFDGKKMPSNYATYISNCGRMTARSVFPDDRDLEKLKSPWDHIPGAASAGIK
jgi:hypothetical protein